MHGADGPGPDYCQLAGCGPEGCEQCPRPGVLPENQGAVQLFMATATQWREGPRGATGLDYTALRTAADWLGMTPDVHLLGQVQVMETETLKIIGKAQRNGD